MAASAELRIEPTLHFSAVGGTTSADSISELAAFAHDPIDELGIQGLDAGVNLHLDDWLKGFVNINAFTDAAGDLDAEWEEGFLKLTDLPYGFEVRGGRFLNRFGAQNSRHLHAWNFVDSNFSTPTFLGEEGLYTEGGELSWATQFDRGFLSLTGSFGNAVVHDHHGEEEDHDEVEEEHEEDEHGHEEGAEDAYFSDTFWTVRALAGFNQDDFNQHRFGLNLAKGDNAYEDGESEVFSADYTYTWRENGLESGGQSISAGAEFFHRNVTYEAGEDASHTGLMLFAAYELNEKWRFDLRYDRINEVEAGPHGTAMDPEYEFAVHGRERYSLAATRAIRLSEDSLARLRLQYNHDKIEEGSEDSIWLQFSYDFGPGEVR